MSATNEGAQIISRWLEAQLDEFGEPFVALRGVTRSDLAFGLYDKETEGTYTVTVLPARLVAGVEQTS